jgi:hypothetical protein
MAMTDEQRRILALAAARKRLKEKQSEADTQTEERELPDIVDFAINRHPLETLLRQGADVYEGKTDITDIPGNLLNKTLANIRTAGQGFVPGFDEGIAAIRATVDPSTYGDDRSWGERYDYAHDLEQQALAQAREEDPLGSLGREMAAGFMSPLNKLGPVTQGGGTAGQALANFGQNVFRNTVEGAAYGYGEGDTAEQRMENAITGGQTGALFTGVADAFGRATGKFLDAAKIPQELVDPVTGEFTPLNLTGDRGRAWLYRKFFGALPGGNQNIVAQQQPMLEEAAESVSNVKQRADRLVKSVEQQQRASRREVAQTARDQRYNIDQQKNYNVEQGAVQPQLQEVPPEPKTLPKSTLQRSNPIVIRQRTENALESIPERERAAVFEGVDMNNPEAMDVAIGRWWRDNAFNDVRALESVPLPKKLVDDVSALSDDPDFRAGIGNVAREVAKRRANISGMEVDAKDVDEMIEDLLSGAIDGDELIALRNSFAIPANRGGQNAGQLRTVANRLDDTIRDIVRVDGGQEAVDFFNEQIARYPTQLTHRKAVYDAYKQDGMYELEGWEDAGKNYDVRIPTETRERRPLSESVRTSKRQLAKAVEAEEAAQAERQASAKVEIEKIKADNKAKEAMARVANAKTKDKASSIAKRQKKELVDRTAGQKEAIEDRARARKESIKKAEEVVLEPAQAKLETLKGRAVPGEANVYLATRSAPGFVKGETPKLGLVAAFGDLMTRPGAQQFVAGQGYMTRMLADAIRNGRTEYVTRPLSAQAARIAAEEEEEY